MSAPKGWTPVDCHVADVIRHSGHVAPDSVKTDLSGNYGKPEVFTEWVLKADTDKAILREHRWPSASDPSGPDAAPCEHYVPGGVA